MMDNIASQFDDELELSPELMKWAENEGYILKSSSAVRVIEKKPTKENIQNEIINFDEEPLNTEKSRKIMINGKKEYSIST